MRTVSLALVTGLCLLAGGKLHADWPTYRFDNARAAATAEKLHLPLTQRWVYQAPAKPTMAWPGPGQRTIEGQPMRHRLQDDDALQPVIADGKLYLGSSVDHQLACNDLGSGKRLWSFFAGAAIRLAPTVWDKRVYFGSDDGYAYCLDAATGRLVWKLRPGPEDDWMLGRGEMISRWPIRTGVTVHDGVAYFGAGVFPHEDVFLYAVDARSGEVKWRRDDLGEEDAGRNPLSPQGYLLANDAYLVVPSGGALPAAFDRLTGKLVHHRTHSWRRDGVTGGTRAILADGHIYAGGTNQLLPLTEDKGDVGFGWFDGREMAVAGASAYTADGVNIRRVERQGYAAMTRLRQQINVRVQDLTTKLRTLEGDEADIVRERLKEAQEDIANVPGDSIHWTTPLAAASAIIATGDLVVVGGEGTVHALDTETGEIVWQAQVDGEARGLAVANGFLVVSTNNGKIHVFGDAMQPASGTTGALELVRNPYPKDDWNAIYERAAREVLETTGVKRGFCLIAGNGEGRLALELARQSSLQIYCVDPDAAKVESARRMLAKAGLYGHRIVVHQADLGDIPYANYFANLIVSDDLLRTGKMPPGLENVYRHLKPLGGVLCLGQPHAVGQAFQPAASLPHTIRKWLEDVAFADAKAVRVADSWTTFTRPALPGAGNWSHQYGDPGNTASSNDQLIKGGLSVLWFGDPGPGKMVNRHEGAVGPLSVNGRLIVQGESTVMAYDAYNGLFLWEYANPETFRTGVFQNNNPGNLVASSDRVFVMNGQKVVELDAATGKLMAEHLLPEGKRTDHEWGYLAHQDGLLIGTATVRKELIERLRRRGRKYEDTTDTIFAIDPATGEYCWTYAGKHIAHQTIALAPNRVFFIDSNLSEEQRQELVRQDNSALAKLEGEEAKLAEERIKRLDARLAVALDARTGSKLWEQAVDVTDCSEIGIGGGKLTLIHADGALVLCGANANGHYWKQFLAGEFKQRRLVVLSAKDGSKLWAKDANYRHRPIVVGRRLIAEPWAFDLHTGEQFTREHPLTGKQVPWSIIRPGHHCGMITACPNMLFFRSGSTGFYDLYNDDGTRHFAGHRLGCWINAIPANGLLMIPEASAGCVCQFSISSTITFEPRQPRHPWTIYSSVGNATPVQRMALNFGAPGDRKDPSGRVWLAYPRPIPGRDTGLDLRLKVNEVLAKGGGFDAVRSDAVKLDTTTPWLYTSWSRGLASCKLPLLGEDDAPAKYHVKLHFADLADDAAPGRRVFDVKVQGETVIKGLDIADVAGASKIVVREVRDVLVESTLFIELAPTREDSQPLLNAIEVLRAD